MQEIPFPEWVKRRAAAYAAFARDPEDKSQPTPTLCRCCHAPGYNRADLLALARETCRALGLRPGWLWHFTVLPLRGDGYLHPKACPGGWVRKSVHVRLELPSFPGARARDGMTTPRDMVRRIWWRLEVAMGLEFEFQDTTHGRGFGFTGDVPPMLERLEQVAATARVRTLMPTAEEMLLACGAARAQLSHHQREVGTAHQAACATQVGLGQLEEYVKQAGLTEAQQAPDPALDIDRPKPEGGQA